MTGEGRRLDGLGSVPGSFFVEPSFPACGSCQPAIPSSKEVVLLTMTPMAYFSGTRVVVLLANTRLPARAAPYLSRGSKRKHAERMGDFRKELVVRDDETTAKCF
jgi:hypothetical protein